MKKKFINLGFLIFSLWGIFTFSCGGSSSLTEGEDQSSDSQKSIKPIQGNKSGKSDNKIVSKKKKMVMQFF